MRHVTDAGPKRVLIVEDDESTAEAVAFRLRRAGFEADIAADGLSGLRAVWTRPPDVLVLDLMLPHLDGWRVVREIRARQRQLPIIVVTARTDERDRLEALALGADDVVSKPFSTRELLARVTAQLRRAAALRAAGDAGDEGPPGGLAIDSARLCATLSGRILPLTPQEFRLLATLVHNAGRTLTRDEIYRQVWDRERRHGDRSVDVLVRRLRRKLEQAGGGAGSVQTLHGVGYRFELPGVTDAAGPEPPAREPPRLPPAA